MSIATWYSQQYAAWARNRQSVLQTPPAMAHQPQGNQADSPAGASKDKKSSDPLFGPSIGPVSNGPSWTLSNEKKVVTDELTPDIVSAWIQKSKEPSQPTTTLQALVNLKRPTLRLSPLTSVQEESTATHVADQHHHGLEFEYDCDAPKCGIYVHVHLPKSHPDAPPTSSNQLSKLLVFETVVDGGFGNHLKLEEGALLELGRFEHSNPPPVEDNLPATLNADVSNSGELPASTTASEGNSAPGRNNQRRRFTHFHFRKRSQNRSISGPALAVVDAEPATQDGKSKDGKDDADEGVKVTIRLAALDEQGTELSSPNEQTTYLHIVRFGQKSTEAATDGETPEDNRPWVVKVVKREATIGPHTFHLHEIFGLTSSTHTTPVATAPPPATTHTYPPEEGAEPAVTFTADDEEPQSECLLCLSSPREVVLLPCRHLVACKECALNMVEFGAGGNITQATEPAAGGDDTGAAAPGGTTVPGTTGAPNPAVTNPAPTRRKRKAKGWFCPVCRQPYTSLLRLTTSSPPVAETKEGELSGTEDEGPPAVPAPVHAVHDGNGTTEVRSGGLLGGALRPGFLRGFSLARTQPPDVENQTAQIRG